MGSRIVTCVGLVGDGALAKVLRQHLRVHYEVRYLPTVVDSEALAALADCALLVYGSDDWSPVVLHMLNQWCIRHNVGLLPVFMQFDWGVVGPCVLPDVPGCAWCASWREIAALADVEERTLALALLAGESRKQTDAGTQLPELFMDKIIQIVDEEITAYWQARDRSLMHKTIWSIDLEMGHAMRHRCIPLGDCPFCSQRVDDNAEVATIQLVSRTKLAHWIYRERALPAAKILLKTYVDDFTGIIQAIDVKKNNAGIIATAHLWKEALDGWVPVAGMGNTGLDDASIDSSISVAIIEALERYASWRPRGKRTMVTASYREVKAEAIDPRVLSLPMTVEVGGRVSAFNDDVVCRWVWGYSFGQARPLLVPERHIYYGLRQDARNPAFARESSNGCAVGQNIEEAIWAGMLEVIERDAFLLTWYAQLAVPELVLDEQALSRLHDKSIHEMLHQLTAGLGYQVRVFNMTLDHDVVCLGLVGIDRLQREDWPRMRWAAAAHPHPEHALARALRELIVSLSAEPQRFRACRQRAQELADGVRSVQGLSDHLLLAAMPHALAHCRFLLETPVQQSWEETFAPIYHKSVQWDLRVELEALIAHYCASGNDVIVVEQRAPELSIHGLTCVKVLLPGLLPLTFGIGNERVKGIPRLIDVPYQLGYTQERLDVDTLKLWPHPFS
jgi:bacteriocin biosynthesis cyclodehydratase domain